MKYQVLVYFIFFMSLISCSEDRVKPSQTVISEKDLPDNELHNSKVVFSDSGKIKAILYSGIVKVYNRKNETSLTNKIKIDFYDADQKHISVLTADSGRVDNLTQDLFAYGNVIARSDSNVVLKTEELRWENNVRKIKTDKFVDITSPKENIRGYGLESDAGLKNYVIFRVSGKIESKEEPGK